jgi:hypothetical protein
VTEHQEIRLSGRTALAGMLRRAAASRGYALAEQPAEAGSAPGLIGPGAAARRIALPADDRLARAIAEHAVRRIAAAWPSKRAASAVLLGPAGIVAGPASAGPVDALVIGDAWVVRHGDAEILARLLVAQQTRCWLALYTAEPSPGTVPEGEDVRTLPGWLATDTARICEYMQDRGSAEDWTQLLLAGPVRPGPDGAAQAVLAFTEAGFAADLLAAALDEGSTR